jgi:hypothetical protein
VSINDIWGAGEGGLHSEPAKASSRLKSSIGKVALVLHSGL